MNPRAAGLIGGFALDLLLGDPRRWHPVAGFGRAARLAESIGYGPSRTSGAAYTASLVGGVAGAGLLIERRIQGRAARTALVAACTWTVLGARSLDREAQVMHGLLASGDLSAARSRLGHLAGRTADELDADEMARAVVESVAENTSDAVVAPLVSGAVFGVPGLLGYRAANTLDAMVGHRSARYARFGWASAKLDDLLNLLPARVAASLTVLLAPVVGGRAADSAGAWRRDASRHPSPNAGPVEAAFAGALGRSLGGRNVYAGVAEDRGRLGNGPAVRPADIPRARRLALAVDAAALGLAVVVSRFSAGRRG